MNIITLIDPVTKYKYKIYIDDRFAFVLNKGDLSHLGLYVGMEITDQLQQEIDEALYKSAREQLNRLICVSDKTCKQVSDNLKRHDFPEIIIEKTVRLGMELGFLNDQRYATNYVSCYAGRKSIINIKNDLMLKGIPSEYIEEALKDVDPSDEIQGIMKLLARKWPHEGEPDHEEKNRLMAYLGRKGYSYELIKKAMDSYSLSKM